MAYGWGQSWAAYAWGNSWGNVTVRPMGETLRRMGVAARPGGGPDAEVSLTDWRRRFGPRIDLPPVVQQWGDDEVLALILCIAAAESLTHA